MTKLVKICMIDDNGAFMDLISEHIKENMPDLRFTIDWLSDFIHGVVFDHDLYIIDNRIHGSPKALEIVKEIKRQDPMGRILVVSGHANLELLKNLINMNIAGFIDKDNFEIVIIINEICQISLKDKLIRLSEKTDELNRRLKIRKA